MELSYCNLPVFFENIITDGIPADFNSGVFGNPGLKYIIYYQYIDIQIEFKFLSFKSFVWKHCNLPILISKRHSFIIQFCFDFPDSISASLCVTLIFLVRLGR